MAITKDDLLEYCAIRIEMKGLERQLDELEAAVYKVGSPRFSGGGAGIARGRFAGEDFSGLLAKLMDLKAVYTRKWDELIDRRAEIECAIETFPSVYRAVMRAKYIEGMTWEEVADEVGYSVRQVHRIHKQMEESLEKQSKTGLAG